MPVLLAKFCKHSILLVACKKKPYQTKLFFASTYHPYTGDSTPGSLTAVYIEAASLPFSPSAFLPIPLSHHISKAS